MSDRPATDPMMYQLLAVTGLGLGAALLLLSAFGDRFLLIPAAVLVAGGLYAGRRWRVSNRRQ